MSDDREEVVRTLAMHLSSRWLRGGLSARSIAEELINHEHVVVDGYMERRKAYSIRRIKELEQ